MTKVEFLDDLSNLNIDLSVYENSRFIIYAMIGLKPATDEEEREAILSILENNHNLEVYLTYLNYLGIYL